MTSFSAHDVHVLTKAEDVAAAAAVFRTAMVGLPLPGFGGDVARYIEPGRTLGIFDGDRVIGGADSFTSWLAVPGGARVPHAGVTHVGVLPTHTRRGAVTALLRRQLRDIADRGEVVATLRASEAVIYERFGYGVATYAADYEVDRRRGGLRKTVPAGGPVRLADPATSGKLLADVYAKAAWPGAIDRNQYWWNFRNLIAAASAGPRYLAVHGPEGAEDGYVSYHPADTTAWFRSRDRAIVVDDLVAHSEQAYLSLVRYLAERDLIDTVRLPGRPVDDPLPLLFTDTRAVQVSGVHDETWLRLVDVPAALAARTYSSAGPVVIAVTDTLLPANAGGYRVGAGGVDRTAGPADISLGVAALGAAYLGGTRFTALAQAGRVTEHRPGALAEADALFATPRAPFAGTSF
ncbi:MAG TPA: GNAT family N-acetyltransferase [Trebonia sp.]|nr:GNAT family N-acetyltransferase [Trebonia sp.]